MKIASGLNHTCAIEDGAAKCWGSNSIGQLGDNTVTSSLVAVTVLGITNGSLDIAAGADHSCVLQGGAVKCWGENNYGQLGDNTTTSSARPVVASGLATGVRAIAVGYQHTCAIRNGFVYCWGRNENGNLGVNDTSNKSVPVIVSGITAGAQSIRAGHYHTCAIVNGGALCWGRNLSGELGANLPADSPTAHPYPNGVSGTIGDVQALAMGSSHTCALVAGAVKCWGSNARGQLGINVTAGTGDAVVPQAVSGLSSGAHGLFPTFGETNCSFYRGDVRCWGANGNGQLGNNNPDGVDSIYPVPVFTFKP